MYKHRHFNTLKDRLNMPRHTIQVITGPRQVGKTTLVRQVLKEANSPWHYASADEPGLPTNVWIEQQWQYTRQLAKNGPAILVLDEVQKLPDWSAYIKKFWDEDTFRNIDIQVVLLGSSPLLMQKGLTESLAGRFETIALMHWSYTEMHDAFGWNIDQYIYYGGYPGSAELIDDETRWKAYINDALIETSISKDILLMNRVDKPALLRQLFMLCIDYSGQILSYQKMLGQLDDAGNTTTLAHYLRLLEGAGMVCGLEKYSPKMIKQRASSPKVCVMNTALKSAQQYISFEDIKASPAEWGRWVESAIGMHLFAQTAHANTNVYYWRERNQEIDFLIKQGGKCLALEVKSGSHAASLKGLSAFKKHFPEAKTLLIGAEGIPIHTFLSTPIDQWIDE